MSKRGGPEAGALPYLLIAPAMLVIVVSLGLAAWVLGGREAPTALPDMATASPAPAATIQVRRPIRLS